MVERKEQMMIIGQSGRQLNFGLVVKHWRFAVVSYSGICFVCHFRTARFPEYVVQSMVFALSRHQLYLDGDISEINQLNVLNVSNLKFVNL